MKNNSPTYNYADIQRYVNGEMSSAEMRRLEMAALDDPFLADALEGHVKSDPRTTQVHLQDIELHILRKENERKIIPLYTRYKWLSIAAVVLLIAGAAWFGSDLLNKPSEELAQNKTLSTPKKDSVVPKTPETLKQEARAETSEVKTKKQTQTSTLANKNTDQNILPASPSSPQVVTMREVEADMAAPTEKRRSDVSARSIIPSKRFEGDSSGVVGTVKDAAGNPVEGASVMLENKKAVTTDKNGNFKLPASDSSKTANIAAIGLQSKEVRLNAGTNNIQLETSSQSLSEVVVTGYSIQKKRSSQPPAKGVLEIDTIGIKPPVIGWKNLKENLIAQIIEPPLFEKKSNMTISFIVNKNKSLRKIKTEKTNHPELSDAIIDYLEAEEFWLPSEERIRLVIRIK